MEKLTSFHQVFAEIEQLPPIKVAVAAADHPEVLQAVKNAKDCGIADFILFGNKERIINFSEEIGFPLIREEIVNTDTLSEACAGAVRAAKQGEANVVMKGMVHSSDFLRAILNRQEGLRQNQALSHVATCEVPGFDRLIHVTDPSLNIAPNLDLKKQIIENVIQFCHSLGNSMPKVAVIGALELVNPNMEATMDAALLTQMNRRRQIEHAVVDGPFALDNAISTLAAELKGIDSPVAGQADVLVVPDIEAGNILYKSLAYFARSQVGALVLGAKVPVVLTSRADSAETKLNSIALAALQANLLRQNG